MVGEETRKAEEEEDEKEEQRKGFRMECICCADNLFIRCVAVSFTTTVRLSHGEEIK